MPLVPSPLPPALPSLNQLDTIQSTLGGAAPATHGRTATTTMGIDVVLGSQWGDEGKGKLVDMLSQVRALAARAPGLIGQSLSIVLTEEGWEGGKPVRRRGEGAELVAAPST